MDLVSMATQSPGRWPLSGIGSAAVGSAPGPQPWRRELALRSALANHILPGLCGRVSVQSMRDPETSAKPETVRRIIVLRPNHRIGNTLLLTPLMQELEARFPQARIELVTAGG